MFQNIQYLNGPPSQMTLPFEYQTPILPVIQMVNVLGTSKNWTINCSVFKSENKDNYRAEFNAASHFQVDFVNHLGTHSGHISVVRLATVDFVANVFDANESTHRIFNVDS